MGKTSETTQTNSPPAWTQAGLEEVADEAARLYGEDKGKSNTYLGPTQAGFSDVTLGGMNNGLAATGYKGAPVSNSTWQDNEAIKQAQKILQRSNYGNNQPQPQQTASAAPAAYQSQKGETQGPSGQVFYNGMQYAPSGEPYTDSSGRKLQRYSAGQQGPYLTLAVV